MTLIGLLVLVIILGVAFWAVRALSAAFSIPEPIRTVILVLLVIVALIVVLNAFGVTTLGSSTLRLK